MKFGIVLPNYGRNASFETIRRAAVAAEELGYDSAWTTDHVLVPKENAEPYGTVYEAIATLALIAESAPRLKLGTSVLVLPMRDPVLMAKQIATIDVATNGRMIVGVGVGWNKQEYRHLHSDFRTRGKRLDEAIQLMRTIWSNERVDFEGKYTQIREGVSLPLPTQRGGPPIWIGGNEEPTFHRVAKLGDGWHATGPSPEEVARGIRRIRELLPKRPVTISARLSVDFDESTSPVFQYLGHRRYRLAGTTDSVRTRVAEYSQAGCELLVLVFPWDAGVEPALVQMEQFARAVMPEY